MDAWCENDDCVGLTIGKMLCTGHTMEPLVLCGGVDEKKVLTVWSTMTSVSVTLWGVLEMWLQFWPMLAIGKAVKAASFRYWDATWAVSRAQSAHYKGSLRNGVFGHFKYFHTHYKDQCIFLYSVRFRQPQWRILQPVKHILRASTIHCHVSSGGFPLGDRATNNILTPETPMAPLWIV